MKKLLASLSLCALLCPAFAKIIELPGKNGTIKIDVLDDLAAIYEDNKSVINKYMSDYTTEEIKDVVEELNEIYNNAKESLGTILPYTTARDGLNDFSDVLCDALLNAQFQQNVWAKSWIGTLIPKPHFGAGINAGVAKLDISPITRTIRALGMDTGDFPDTLVMPTVAVDIRLGGFVLPFDVGFAICAIDTSALGLDDTIDPAFFDYFSIGGDVRYNVFALDKFETRISVGAGAYYTKGSLGIDDSDYATAKLEFNSTSLFLSAQASAKFLIFVPFAGTRVVLNKSNVDWSVSLKWREILGAGYEVVETAIEENLLPSKIDGGASNTFFENIHPMLFGGVGLDAGPIDITLSGSFDIATQIPSGAFSVRFAL